MMKSQKSFLGGVSIPVPSLKAESVVFHGRLKAG